MKRLIPLLLCVSILLSACSGPKTAGPDVFYYPSSTHGQIDTFFVPESRELPKNAGLEELLDLYCAGPVTTSLAHSLPSNARVLSSSVEEGVLNLHFSRELSQISGVELTIAAGCLALTFLGRCDAHTLVLTAEGALLNGETAFRLTLADLNLQDNSPDRVIQQFTIYYSSTDRRYLIGEEISIQVSSQKELPMLLLEQLLTSPETRGIRSPLPFGTQIENVTIEDGLCTVDLSQEFETRRFSSAYSQYLSLLSIVNTLTALPQIQRVEFTVEGNLLIRYGSLSIDQPFAADLRSLFKIDMKDLFIEMLDDFSNLTGRETPELILEKVASMSCKAAVKGNQNISFMEFDALVEELLTLENPYNCPHGRPTIISMTKYEIEKKFKRII